MFRNLVVLSVLVLVAGTVTGLSQTESTSKTADSAGAKSNKRKSNQNNADSKKVNSIKPAAKDTASKKKSPKKSSASRLRKNGTGDNSSALQKLVDSKKGGIRLARGVYRITKPIVINLDEVGVTSITGDGTATVVMAGPGPAFRFVGTHQGTADPSTVKDNVWTRQRAPMVTGIEIVGDHNQACGIQADGTMQLTISKVVLRKLQHGIHLVNRNRNVIIESCHIYENSGIGIFYDSVDLHQSNIVGSHISYNYGGGIVVKSGNVRNIHIGTCDIEGNMSKDGEPTANILLDSTGGSIAEVAITGCTIQHSHNAKDSANIRVNGECTPRPFTSETRHGHLTIANNVLSDVQVNVDLLNVRSVTMTGNTVWKGYQHDLRMQNCSHVVIGNNMFDRNPRYNYGDGKTARQGLLLTECNDCTLTGNHIVSAGDIPAALQLTKCNRINITGASVLDAKNTGILLTDVTNSRISNCIVNSTNAGTSAASIKIEGGKGNMIVNNQLGVDLQTSDLTAYIDGNTLNRD